MGVFDLVHAKQMQKIVCLRITGSWSQEPIDQRWGCVFIDDHRSSRTWGTMPSTDKAPYSPKKGPAREKYEDY